MRAWHLLLIVAGMPETLPDTAALQGLADALFDAFERGEAVDPPTQTLPSLTPELAYAVQQRLIERHAERGRSVAGHKVGLTSLAMQEQLGIDSPDFGVVLDSHSFPSGATLSRSEHHMLLPKLEPELAFVLDRPLSGPGLTDEQVMAAVSHVIPVMEVIDSRVRDWRIGLADTIADNASCFGAVLGTPVPIAEAGSLPEVAVTFAKDDATVQEGRGDAVLGDPVRAVTWLANQVGELPAGRPILAGSFTAAVDASPGRFTADFGPAIGTVHVEITE